MKTLKFLTWLDVKRFIRKKTIYGRQLPEGITNINCFSDALEINIISFDYRVTVENTLQNWFSDWYQKDTSIIQLDIGNAVLPVEFVVEEVHSSNPSSIRPFWEEVAYVSSNDEENTNIINSLTLPEPYSKLPFLIAFYSFKGGVGRTVHLAAHLFALLQYAKEVDKAITILVIDADLEAPGLTYWDRSEKQQPSVSFIDFLEVYHYSPLPTEETLDFFVKEIKKSPKSEGKSVFYFLPACLNDEQLLDTPVLPEHLARSPKGEWACGNAIHQLGEALKADYILVDLRAGLSEISSPLIFDPRIQRFFITTATEQSIAGLSLVLEQVSRIAPSDVDIDNNKYFDPTVIVSFLTPELKSLTNFENALIKFRTSYIQSIRSEEASIYSKRLEIKETDFAQELLYINSWEEARTKLASTSLIRVAKEWAETQLKSSVQQVNLETKTNLESSVVLEEVRKFRDICQQYEFAESGEGEGLLVTEPLKNLATTFREDLPRIVSIGAKGAGKTFIYVQLSRFKYWEKFIQLALKENEEIALNTHIFPILQSGTLRDAAEKIIKDARDAVRTSLGDAIPDFIPSEYQDRIRKAILKENTNELEWTEFWIREIARTIGLQNENQISLSNINNFLKSKKIRIVFLFDGLEDIFAEAAINTQQQIALRALINLPKRLSEIRQSHVGLIILLRRDFLRYAITQNLAQFESLYRPYDLSWDVDSFLKLVYWVCSQANVIEATEAEIDDLSKEEFVAKLEKLWGEKLGGVKEAYTASWVFAALTDFKGRLQARDIVRLLYHAADITVQKSKEIQFEKWSSNRLLPPQAIRRALEPCSEKKVREAKEEYPEFKKWVDKIETEYTQEQKRIPFIVEDLDLDQVTIRMLEDMGVIYEDRAKDDVARYYMPEIFRTGLKFNLERGARPRVLVLKRKALGIGVL
ncbi:ParA family protein [Nostoc punctiforme FACHB-252]|uniref:ParA family protein n=1 Tax=Nostoc punctiforme FACHB-252 TaxID=1357509 RepID=A0ABR8HL47_NOSPU|nr:ParA family protein [Nostoc punctiforme]MBD2616575.1 ParA family protein [Nostoc punctiforme FACHB-252]